MEAEDSIFDYPCDFPIKAMGKAEDATNFRK
jgi:putative lipoic acid-binding regulatory protein